ATIYARIDYQWGDDEREIRLKPNREILIAKLEVDGNEIDVSSLPRVSTGERWLRLNDQAPVTVTPSPCFRISLPVEALSKSDVQLIMQAQVTTDEPYNLDDIPDVDDEGHTPFGPKM